MTDPAPSPAAGQPPVPDRPMPSLGGGLVWSDILAKIEADRPTPTPSLGATGSSRGDQAAAPYPSSAIGEEPDLPLMAEPRVPQNRAGVTRYRRPGLPRLDVSAPIPLGPEPDELLAMADDLNAHGGLDETFVAGLVREAVEQVESCHLCQRMASVGISDRCRYHRALREVADGGSESGDAPATPSLGATGSSLGVESAPGHRNGCRGCEHDEGVIPGCWSEQDEEEWYALFRARFASINEVRAETGPRTFTITKPGVYEFSNTPRRRARWRRALDRIRRSQP